MRRSVILICAFLFVSCNQRVVEKESLSMIQIYDRNGFQETISNQERLVRYEKNNYMDSQPYERVVRTFVKNTLGQTPGRITSYHQNGQIWQYLETVNGRANGKFREWHSNGKLHMEAMVVEGRGDLSLEATATWIFDGVARVYDDQGALEAVIPYDRGTLVENSLYYYPNGQLKRVLPYFDGKLHGESILYREDGERLGISTYKGGVQDGLTEFFGSKDIPRYREVYLEGILLSGNYYAADGQIVSQVAESEGVRTHFENGQIKQQETIKKGVVEGKVAIYNAGVLENVFNLVDGEKHGEEWIYYTPTEENFVTLEPKMVIDWYHGEMHGKVKSWYLGNRIESHREMVHNKKHGFYSCWYGDGSMMFVEEYDMGRLVNGKYYQRSDPIFVSAVEDGSGIATFFDYEGYFVSKVTYLEGQVVGSASRR